MSETEFTVIPERQDVIATRVLDAPPNVVYEACTNPSLIPEWWGPARLATSVEKLDARPGGVFRILQRDPQGIDYAFHGVYHESTPRRIVRTMEFEGMTGQVVLEVATLEEIDGKTKLTVKSIFESVDTRDRVFEMGMRDGMLESFDRLDALLRRIQSGQRKAA